MHASFRTWYHLVAVSLALGTAGAVAAQVSASAERASQASQRITLDLKGVDVLDVLKLLSQKSGLSFIAGRNVTGKVTLFINEVDVWDAFELIVGANDLAYERRGDVITVMMARDYELIYGEKFQGRTQDRVVPLQYAKAEQVATVLNQLKSSVGRVVADEASNTLVVTDVPGRLAQMEELLKRLDRPTQTRVYTLNYADAEKLKEKVQGLLSPVGTFTFDARTNKAIVADLPDVLEKTDHLVRAFDTPDGEVLIEAKIIKVELNDELNTGIDWQRLFFGVDTTNRGNFRVLGDVIGGTASGVAVKIVSESNADSRVIIEALKKIGKTETLSNPRITVTNNQEAKILVGTKEAFVTTTVTVPSTGSTVSSPEIQFVDVGTKLFVTPNIKRDGYIQLKVRPEVSSSTVTEFQNNRIPIITSTEAETNVLVKSGVTLVIGGLIDTKDQKTENRVPWLGSIPIVGIPFRGTTDVKKKTELVVLLTPQIIMPDGTAYVPPPASEQATVEEAPAVVLRDPVPAGYREAVRQRLQEALASHFRAAALSQGSVVLSFVLSHDGRLVGAAEVTSPEGEPFILAATTALQAAVPFSPFPEGSQATEVRFRLAVDYVP